MVRVFVGGFGAVSPAGWSAAALVRSLGGDTLPTVEIPSPDRDGLVRVRPVPPPAPRPAELGHPRLRRASPIAQFCVAAAFEALRHRVSPSVPSPSLGVVCSVMSGSVVYSRRFYEEVLNDPPTASPLLFPETVFNAPASHVSAIGASSGPNYTLVGDAGMFLQSLALAADWIRDRIAGTVLVVGTEESDWTSAGALTRFHRRAVPSEGAGAILLSADPTDAKAELVAVGRPRTLLSRASRLEAAREVDQELRSWRPTAKRFDAWSGEIPAEEMIRGTDVARVLGDGLAAVGAWACVAACSSIASGGVESAGVRVVGANQQVIGALFSAPDSGTRPPVS